MSEIPREIPPRETDQMVIADEAVNKLRQMFPDFNKIAGFPELSEYVFGLIDIAKAELKGVDPRSIGRE